MPPSQNTTQPPRPVVLVVDDDDLVRRTMARLLSFGSDWRVVDTGPEGLDAGLSEADVVVCDVHLGEDLLGDELFPHDSDVPVLYVSGNTAHIQRLQDLGLQVLRKPFDDQSIIGAVEALLRRRPASV